MVVLVLIDCTRLDTGLAAVVLARTKGHNGEEEGGFLQEETQLLIK